MASSSDHRLVVVGGGILGLTVAATALQRSPDVSVTVLEKAEVGSGASGYAGTLDIPYGANAFDRQLAERSWAWHDARGASSKAYRRPVPITWYAEPGDNATRLKRSMTEPLSPHRAEGSPKWQAPAGTREHGGPAFLIDCPGRCRSLAREIEASDRGRVVEEATVVAIEEKTTDTVMPETVTRVTCAEGRTFDAEHVVVSLGPWLTMWNEQARSWAEDRGLRTKRVSGLNIDVDSDLKPQHAVAWPSQDMHFHPSFEGGDYRMSFRDSVWDVDPSEPVTLAGADLDPVDKFLDRLLGTGRWSVSGHRIFADSYTPDFKPIVDRCPPIGKSVTVITGTHGSGVRLAPGLADLAVDDVFANLRWIAARRSSQPIDETRSRQRSNSPSRPVPLRAPSRFAVRRLPSEEKV